MLYRLILLFYMCLLSLHSPAARQGMASSEAQEPLKTTFQRAQKRYRQGVDSMEQYLQKLERLGQMSDILDDPIMKAIVVKAKFDLCSAENSRRTSVYAFQLEQSLKTVTADDYPPIVESRLALARYFYDHRDYQRAQALYQDIIASPYDSRFFQSFFHARLAMGLIQLKYCHNADLSEYWLRQAEMFHHAHRVARDAEVHRAWVQGGLGRVAFYRHQYERSIGLLRHAIDIMQRHNNKHYVYDSSIYLAEAYCRLGHFTEAKTALDTAFVCGNSVSHEPGFSRAHYFSVLSMYHAGCGRALQAMAYQDSAKAETDRYNALYNMNSFLVLRENIDHDEILKRDQEVESSHRHFTYILWSTLVLLLAFVVVLIFYIPKRRAYQQLVRESQLWASASPNDYLETTTPADDSDTIVPTPRSDNGALLTRIRTYVDQSHCYANPDITLSDIAMAVASNDRYVSRAINGHYRNFNAFINEYRVREAVCKITHEPQVPFAQVMFEVGFNARKTFYNAFKQHTGLSPTDFREVVSQQQAQSVGYHSCVLTVLLMVMMLFTGPRAQAATADAGKLVFSMEQSFKPFLRMPYGTYHYALRDTIRRYYSQKRFDDLKQYLRVMNRQPDYYHDRRWQLNSRFTMAILRRRLGEVSDQWFEQELISLGQESRNVGNTIFSLRVIREQFDFYRVTDVYKGVEAAYQLEKALSQVTYSQYPDVIDCYFRLGIYYYDFNDIPRAERLFRQTVNTPYEPAIFMDFIHARNYLGLIQRDYYHNLDSADYWFRQMGAFRRQHHITWDSFAKEAWELGNLGHNQLLRHNYAEGLAMENKAIAMMQQHGEDSYVYGACLTVADVLCHLGRYGEARQRIDTALACEVRLVRKGPVDREQYYRVMVKYCDGIGDFRRSLLYRDSADMARLAHQDTYNMNASLLLREKLEQIEIEQKVQEAASNRHRFWFFAILTIVLLSGVIFVVVLYYQKRRAYQVLVRNAQLWGNAHEETVSSQSIDGDADQQLLARITSYVEQTRCYTNPAVTLADLAAAMGTNERYVSDAINTHYRNFSAMINEYRVRDVVRIITRNPNVPFAQIMYEVGFNTRKTFYNAFKMQTGLSPSEFRANLE